MRIELHEPEHGWRLIQALEADVYPPEVMATVPWRDVVWAHADLRVIAWSDDENPVTHVGVYLRHGRGDGRALRLGGIGGVMTRTDKRGQGFAAAAMTRAVEYLRDRGDIDVGLLFCESHNVVFYERLGWRSFEGQVIVEQPEGHAPFEVIGAMTLDCIERAPQRLIDLCGLPW